MTGGAERRRVSSGQHVMRQGSPERVTGTGRGASMKLAADHMFTARAPSEGDRGRERSGMRTTARNQAMLSLTVLQLCCEADQKRWEKDVHTLWNTACTSAAASAISRQPGSTPHISRDHTCPHLPTLSSPAPHAL